MTVEAQTMNRFLSFITNDVWSIAEGHMQNLIDGMKDETELKKAVATSKEDYTGFSNILGTSLQMQTKGINVFVNTAGVASVLIDTMIMTRANWLTEWLGIITIEGLTNTIKELDANVAVNNILLVMDTPGGVVTNTSQAVQAIEESKTPVDTFVVGSMTSLGVWIGSATRHIWATPTAVIGSVGIMQMARKSNNSDRIDIISNLSPLKNKPADSAEGRAERMAIVDGMAKVMIADIARGYGITPEDVLENFGQGASFIAEEAKKRGMIQGISVSVEDFIKNIDEIGKISNISSMHANSEMNKPNQTEGHAMGQQNTETPEPVPAVAAAPAAAVAPAAAPAASTVDPVAQERERIQGIEAVASNFAKAPVAVQTKIQAIITDNKFKPEATAETVNALIVGQMNDIFSGVETDALGGGREIAAAAAALPVGDELNNTPDTEEAKAKAAEDLAMAGMAEGMGIELTKTGAV